ncbi:MAG: tRNA pseudouridine(38-40) synthase TruA [Bacteroidaceae bacterium]|nr:tRNA pseudouridine(38-40) synthase TruA [Bacteroidaceae bacterium]
MRYFITLSYDGTAYHGWQIQPHSTSVQEELQRALSTLLRQQVEVVGAGRTDTGVHARRMTAHFDFGALDCAQLTYKLNKILPRDIAVQRVEEVPEDMHARFSAKSRTYHYYVHLGKDPFLRAYSWQVYGNPDFDLMNRAARVLMEYRDFTSFSKTNTDTLTNYCTITEAHWDRVGEDAWRFTITANRFLRNMVRAIVGTLMEVGRGRVSMEELRCIVEAKDRCRAGDSVPGNALFLVDVEY